MNTIEHQVRERAYYIWEGEGRLSGRAVAHWVQAEAELTAATGEGAQAGVEAEAIPVLAPAVPSKPATRAKVTATKVAASKAAGKKPTAKTAAAPKASPKKAIGKAQAGAAALH